MRIHEARYAVRPRYARVNLASSALMLAMSSLQAKRHGEAVQLLERALSLRRETAAEDPKSAVAALRVAAVLNRIGLAYREWGRPKEAVQYGEQALVEARKVWELDRKNVHALVSWCLRSLTWH